MEGRRVEHASAQALAAAEAAALPEAQAADDAALDAACAERDARVARVYAAHLYAQRGATERLRDAADAGRTISSERVTTRSLLFRACAGGPRRTAKKGTFRPIYPSGAPSYNAI